MAAPQAAGIHTRVDSQKVFVRNGRLPLADGGLAGFSAGPATSVPWWTLEQNGFCLLTDRPLPVQQTIFDEVPGRFGTPSVFRFKGAEAEKVATDKSASCDLDSQFAVYYKHIAEAAKSAFPEAEYVVVNGHVTFSAEVNQLKNVAIILGGMLKNKLARIVSKLCGVCVPCKAEDKTPKEKEEGKDKAHTVPPFGATQFLHVDMAAEQGARGLAKAISGAEESASASAAPQWRLPVEFLSGASKQRRVVVANLWRNLRAEADIRNHHLAVLDAQTVSEEELRSSLFKNVFIGGQEQYHLQKLKEEHQLVYFPGMTQREILIFKQGAYDVEAGAAAGQYRATPAAGLQGNFIFHTAIVDPSSPQDAVPRKGVVCAGVTVVMPETEPQLS